MPGARLCRASAIAEKTEIASISGGSPRVKTMWRQAPITAAIVIASAVTGESSAIGMIQGLQKVAEVVFGCLVGVIVRQAMSRVWLIRGSSSASG